MTGNPGETIRTAAQYLDENGYFRDEDAVGVRDAVSKLAELDDPPRHPSEVFGPWETLPGPARAALRHLAEQDISLMMSLYPRGSLWPRLGRALYSLGKTFRGWGGDVSLARWAEMWSARVWKAPAKMARKVNVLLLATVWRRGRRASVGGLMAALRRPPSWLLGDYLEGVRVDPRARGFFFDRRRTVAWGYLIGIDLIPSDDGVWCIEANLNTGAYAGSSKTDEEVEARFELLFRTAKDQGFRNLWWWGMDLRAISPWLMTRLETTGRKLGMSVKVTEDFRVRTAKVFPDGIGRPRKRLVSPRDVPEGTLVLRRNSYSVGPDFVISKKEPFTLGVGAILETTGETRCRVPAMTRVPENIPPPSGPGLPNLVYKYSDSREGRGVFFMRVTHREEAIEIARRIDKEEGEPPGLFQPFVCSRLLPGGRVYDVRSEILLTPFGTVPLYSVRREATRPVPNTLRDGLVAEEGVFTSNLATGGRLGNLEPAEESEIQEAATSVGEALVTLLSRGFETLA